MKSENARIEKAGLRFAGNKAIIKMVAAGRGWCCELKVPMDKVKQLFMMFRDDFDGNFEDGVWLEDLKGKPVKIWFKGNDILTGEVAGIGDMLCYEHEMLKLKESYE